MELELRHLLQVAHRWWWLLITLFATGIPAYLFRHRSLFMKNHSCTTIVAGVIAVWTLLCPQQRGCS